MIEADEDTQFVLDWGHLPAVAMQALGQHCCPASRAKLRQVCHRWHDALSPQFTELYIGPGAPWPDSQQQQEQEQMADGPVIGAAVETLQRSFPAAHTVHVIASSTRDYPPSYTQDLSGLLSSTPGLLHLTLQELHELEDFDNLDPASLWDALEGALPALSSRLVGLSVADCFWNVPELFGVLRQLTGLTQLRLANNPLETACEVGIIASLSQLRVLEFGLIFDGSSQHHDVPRALEAIGDLQQLQELSLPMWRRSLGGRAHPLAPALSAALGRLTQLTSLAVDGKFGHLCCVSSLTNLRRLASAAPLSVEGWQAISQLPQLTLLTSLTPPVDPLRLNPSRPHNGLDLGLLSLSRSSLVGLDVAVMQPEHLATLGQFTQLQRLNLRCSSTFTQSGAQGQLLTALSCLPGGLTALCLGPMLPLSYQLISTLAVSCPMLKTLQARFTHVAGPGGTALGLPGMVAAVQDDADLAQQLQDQLSNSSSGAAAAEEANAEVMADMDMDAPAAAASPASPMSVLSGRMNAGSNQEDAMEGVDPAEAAAVLTPASAPPSSSCSISKAVSKLQGLQALELTLVGEDEGEEEGYPFSSGGGAAFRSSMIEKARVSEASGGAAMPPVVQLLLEDLPCSLQQLVLTGPWQLALQPPAAESANGSSDKSQLPCLVCGRSSEIAAAVAAGAGDPTAAEETDSHTTRLCECTSGLGVLNLSCKMPASSGPMAVPAALLGAAPAAAAAAAAGAAVPAQQQQQQKLAAGSSIIAPSAAAVAAAAGTGAGSPVRHSGLKRPGSYTAAAVADDSSAAAAVVDPVYTSNDAAAIHRPVSAVDVFLLEQQDGLGKRTRSVASIVGGQRASVAGEEGMDSSLVGELAEQPPATKQQRQLPRLNEVCLFNCHVTYQALVQLVVTAGIGLTKLQLLQVHTSTAADAGELEQHAGQAAAVGVAGGGNASSRSSQRFSSGGGKTGRAPLYAWQSPGELTAQQLLQLPVAWSHLQEWHLHPHHLWGLLRAGCFAGSSGSSTAMQQQSGLQHVSQLLNLRHMYVVNRPRAFTAAYPAVKERRSGEAVTCLPLHDRSAVQVLLQQLQCGLQQLPALRQLLLYLGHVAPQHPDLADACDDVWTEAGERLLAGMPACKVKLYAPSVCIAGGAAAPAAVAATAASIQEASGLALMDGGGI